MTAHAFPHREEVSPNAWIEMRADGSWAVGFFGQKAPQLVLDPASAVGDPMKFATREAALEYAQQYAP